MAPHGPRCEPERQGAPGLLADRVVAWYSEQHAEPPALPCLSSTTDMHPLSEHPLDGEFAPFYANYIAQVPKGDVLRTLATQIGETLTLVRALPEERGGFRYAPGKWSIREVLGHLIDTERIFDHRALSIARGDANPLAGFDENAYALASGSDHRTIADLAAELEIVRRSTVALFSSFSGEAIRRRGTANNNAVSVRAVPFIIAGHERHHLHILRSRYLSA